MNIRKYFQFSPKDLLWLLSIAAIVTVWGTDKILQDQRVSKSIAAANAEREEFVKARKKEERSAAEWESRLTEIKEFDKQLATIPTHRPDDEGELIMFLDGTSWRRTRKDLEDENKELRLKILDLQRIIADLEGDLKEQKNK